MLFSADQAWAILIFIYISVDPIYLPMYFKLLTCFIQWPFLLIMFISLFRLMLIYSVLSVFTINLKPSQEYTNVSI